MTKLIFLTFILSVAIAFSQNIEQSKYRLAQSYESVGDFINAEVLYEELYRQNQNNLDYLNGLIRCKKNLSKFTELIPIVEEAVQRKPSVELYSTLAELNWRTGKLNHAKDYWSKAINLEPQKEETYRIVSNTQSSLQQFNLAVETYLLGRKNLRTNAIFSEELFRLYLITQDYKSAINETFSNFENSLNINNAQAKLGLLVALNDKQVNSQIESKLKSYPRDKEIYYKNLTAWFYRSIGEFDKALDIYIEQDKERNFRGYEVLNFASSCLNDGQFDIATKGYEYVVSLGKTPYLLNALYGLARTFEAKAIEGKNFDKKVVTEIIERYESLIEKYPDEQITNEIRYRAAEFYARYLFDYPNALKHLETIRSVNPKLQTKALFLKADLLLFQYQFDQAREIYFQTAKKNKQSNTEEYYLALLKIANSLYYQGNLDSSLYYYSELLVDAPADITSEALIKSLFIEANKQYNYAMEQIGRAELKIEQNNLDSAISIYENCLESTFKTPLEEYINLQLAKLYIKTNNFEKCENILKKFPDSFSNSIYLDEALFNLGVCYFLQDKNTEAIAIFTELLTKFPKSIYNSKARSYIEKIKEKQS